MLIGEEYEDEEGGKEDVMIRVATGYLRLEFERLLYPGEYRNRGNLFVS